MHRIYRTNTGEIRLSMTAKEDGPASYFTLTLADVLQLRDDASRVLSGEPGNVLISLPSTG